MEVSVNTLYILCMFVLCKTAEIPTIHPAGEAASKPENSQSVSSSFVQESNEFRFHKKNDSSTSLIPPHTNTKWSPWIPIPHEYNVKENSSVQRGNIQNAGMENSANGYIGNYNVSNKTSVEMTSSNMTLKETFINKTNQTDTSSLNHNRPDYVVTSSSETTKSMSNVRDKKTRTSYSRGITYYFWDTVLLFLKCFKDHWKTGVIDCVTARASTVLDGLLGIGGTRRHQLVNQGGLMPYDEILEESPRNEERLPLDEDDEEEEEEEEDDAYDDETTDSREGEEEKYGKKKIKKGKRHMKTILMAIVATMIPMIAAAKLKYFIMLSLGLGLLGLIIGKTIMFSMLALPAAILGGHNRHSNFWRRTDHMDNHHPLSRVGTDPYAGGRHFT